MDIKFYNSLPKEAKKIRELVFIEEQGFQDEFDEIDSYAKHLVLFDDTNPVATCRFFQEEKSGEYVIGRIAVMRQYRGQNIGARILKIVEEKISELEGTYIVLHAQLRVKKFYEKQGYTSYGEIDFDEDCPHIWMRKKVGKN